MTLYILPIIFIMILCHGFYKKINVFDAFLKGANQGAATCLNILPTLVGLVVATSMMRASGFFDFICRLSAPLFDIFNFPSDVLPLALLKSVSGSGALAMVKDIFQNSGVDS